MPCGKSIPCGPDKVVAQQQNRSAPTLNQTDEFFNFFQLDGESSLTASQMDSVTIVVERLDERLGFGSSEARTSNISIDNPITLLVNHPMLRGKKEPNRHKML